MSGLLLLSRADLDGDNMKTPRTAMVVASALWACSSEPSDPSTDRQDTAVSPVDEDSDGVEASLDCDDSDPEKARELDQTRWHRDGRGL